MIHQLLDAIKTILEAGFAGIGNSPALLIPTGKPIVPAMGALPGIALYAGPLEISQSATDGVSSQVRPQAERQRIAVNGGPYSLKKTPLEGSLICQAVYSEVKKLLVEKKDFTIDYANRKLNFGNTDLTKVTELLVQYSFPGVFTVREFSQVFFMDVFDDDPGDLERWAALSVAVVLTNHDELLRTFNNPTQPTKHTANDYFSVHTLRSISLLEGTPVLEPNLYKMQMKFMAQGELRLVKEIGGGYGLIESIHSPGKTGTGHPVDIEPGLG